MDTARIIACFLLLVLQTGCTGPKQTVKTMTSSFDKQGHRGCRGLMPENTIPAMLKALEVGVTTLEMDAHITRDSQVIISHDPFFNREITTKPGGSFLSEKEEKETVIYRMTYAETQRYDVGLKFYSRFPRQQKIAVHKPLLGELIDSAERYCGQHHRALPFYNIETKSQPSTDLVNHPAPDVFVDLLMGVILSRHIEKRVIIQSFDIRTLQIIHSKYPAIRTALLIEGQDLRPLAEQLQQLGFNPSIYSPEYNLVNTALLQQCHREHILVIPWTVDDAANIDRLQKMGVDGIITDYPDLFR